jgi:hypothetical protein
MQIAGIPVVAILFVAGIGFVLAGNIVAHTILGEVNGRRPPEQQYPTVLTPFFKVWAEHERVFPESRRRLYFIVFFLAGITCCFVAFWGGVLGL